MRLLMIMAVATATFLNGQQTSARTVECADYYLERVAYLLGCCGDQVVNYAGPRFPYPLSEMQRATFALKEIDRATATGCRQDGPEKRLDLLLNRVGALLLRARARLRVAQSAADLHTAEADAETASRELHALVAAHPRALEKLWFWVASSFRVAGRSWAALGYLSQLDRSSCCKQYLVNALKGDILFDLGVYDAAARAYSLWLGSADRHDVCAMEAHLARAAELHRRGFKIEGFPAKNPDWVVCGAGSDVEWAPYVGVPN